MKATTVIYWSRAGLGSLAGLASTFISPLFVELPLVFFNGISIALLVYIASYYAFKSLFMTQVEKPTKIFTMGIGAYFLTWLVAWVVFYTLYFRPT